MSKPRKPKSIREVMSDVGRAADTKLDAISKSVKRNEKDIADMKKAVMEIKKALAGIAAASKKTSAARKTTQARKSNTAKKKNGGKKKEPKKKA